VNSQLQTAFAPTGVLRVSINVGNPILAKRVDDRAVTGVSVDMAHALAQQLGLPLELVVFESAGESVAAVIDERADVGFFAIDPKRGQEIAFTDAYVLIEGYYLVRDDSPITLNESVDRANISCGFFFFRRTPARGSGRREAAARKRSAKVPGPPVVA